MNTLSTCPHDILGCIIEYLEDVNIVQLFRCFNKALDESLCFSVKSFRLERPHCLSPFVERLKYLHIFDNRVGEGTTMMVNGWSLLPLNSIRVFKSNTRLVAIPAATRWINCKIDFEALFSRLETLELLMCDGRVVVRVLDVLPSSLTKLNISSRNTSLQYPIVFSKYPQLIELKTNVDIIPKDRELDEVGSVKVILPDGLQKLSIKGPWVDRFSLHSLPPSLITLKLYYNVSISPVFPREGFLVLPRGLKTFLINTTPRDFCDGMLSDLPPTLTKLCMYGEVFQTEESAKLLPKTLTCMDVWEEFLDIEQVAKLPRSLTHLQHAGTTLVVDQTLRFLPPHITKIDAKFDISDVAVKYIPKGLKELTLYRLSDKLVENLSNDLKTSNLIVLNPTFISPIGVSSLPKSFKSLDIGTFNCKFGIFDTLSLLPRNIVALTLSGQNVTDWGQTLHESITLLPPHLEHIHIFGLNQEFRLSNWLLGASNHFPCLKTLRLEPQTFIPEFDTIYASDILEEDFIQLPRSLTSFTCNFGSKLSTKELKNFPPNLKKLKLRPADPNSPCHLTTQSLKDLPNTLEQLALPCCPLINDDPSIAHSLPLHIKRFVAGGKQMYPTPHD